MFSLQDIRNSAEGRKLLRIYLFAALLWIALFVVLSQTAGSGTRLSADIDAGDGIIANGLLYKSYPASRKNTPASQEAEPLTVLSDIVNALSLRDRLQQLQANSSGILVQLERMYGNEVNEFLLTLESRGLQIKTAELKPLPAGDIRLLNVTLLLETKR